MNITLFFDILGLILSIAIVLFFTVAFWYNCKYLILSKTKGKYDSIFLVITTVSLIWIILFSYIIVQTFNGIYVIDNSSFGAIFIRPIILMTSVGTAISSKIRYIVERDIQKWIHK